jgi:hypothetical protein
VQEFDFVFDADGVDLCLSDSCGRGCCRDFDLGVIWDDIVVQALSVKGDVGATF